MRIVSLHNLVLLFVDSGGGFSQGSSLICLDKIAKNMLKMSNIFLSTISRVNVKQGNPLNILKPFSFTSRMKNSLAFANQRLNFLQKMRMSTKNRIKEA